MSRNKVMKNKATIKHIEFWVADLKCSIEFYKGIFDIIGWDFIEDNAFSNGDTKIYFVEMDVKSQYSAGPRHLCFLASSREIVDAVGQFLVKNDYDVIRGPKEYYYKNRSSYTVDFRDPDGYVIEVATQSVVFNAL